MTTVTITRKEYYSLRAAYRQLKKLEKIVLEEEVITEEDILRWSREAKTLKRRGQLPVLKSLKALRS